ncbi:MAG: response regulator [Lachnospiraceae bacterium]|nr:response regulator [Lachnospiraceae bacterium]
MDDEKRIMVLGEKETFLIRILVKKIRDAGFECDFVPWEVNGINEKWDSSFVVTVYMDTDVRPADSVIHFIADKASETGKQIITIGETNDIAFFCDRVPGDIIYKTFVRPVDNEKYIETLKEIQSRKEAGEFRKNILIVDDDPNYLNLVRGWLKDTYKVAMVNSGLQALKWLGMNKADLILLDYEMPVTTGPQVLEMLRSDEDTKKIPVIFLTGKGDKESVMAVVALKPEGYFLKNIQKEELLEKLRDFFILHK